MFRTVIMGVTLSLTWQLVGQMVKLLYSVSAIKAYFAVVLLTAIGLSLWILKYPQPDTEAFFMLFWSLLGLVLGVGL